MEDESPRCRDLHWGFALDAGNGRRPNADHSRPERIAAGQVVSQGRHGAVAVRHERAPVRQLTHRYGRDQLRYIGCGVNLYDIFSADGDICELALHVSHDIDVIRNWAGIEDCQNIKGRLCVKHLGFANVFQREPHLPPIRRRGNIGTEGGCLGNSGDDLVTFDINDRCLRSEAGADIAIFSVWPENCHSRAVADEDSVLVFIGPAVDNLNVILSSHRDPYFAVVRGMKDFVWGSAYICDVLDRIRSSVNEGYGVRGDRNHIERFAIERESHTMHQHLAIVACGVTVASLTLAIKCCIPVKGIYNPRNDSAEWDHAEQAIA